MKTQRPILGGALALTLGLAPLSAGSDTIGTILSGMVRPHRNNEAENVVTSAAPSILRRDSFSIRQREVVRFTQPDTDSELLIIVTGNMPTEIDGTLVSNGRVAILNPNGVFLGSSGVVDTLGGFLATTRKLYGNPLVADRPIKFESASGVAVSNAGCIFARHGDVFLLGHTVENQGSITGSNVFLASGEGITTVSGKVTASNARQGGRIDIAGGTIEVSSSARIDASGTSAGGSVRIGGGLRGDDGEITNARTTTIGAGAVIFADARDHGDGGSIIVWADAATSFRGHLSARGGADGGNGGFAEVSGKQWLGFSGSTDLSAPAGSEGTLLLDPEYLTIQASDPDLAGDGSGLDVSGNIAAGDYPGANSVITSGQVANLLASANLSLAATNSLMVSAPITWNSAFSLTLEAGSMIRIHAAMSNGGSGNITFNSPGDIILGNNITTGGSQTYNGRVFLVANSILTSTGSGAISFPSTLNGARDLTVNTAGMTTFGGAVGATHPLASLKLNGGGVSINNPVSLAGDLTASGSSFILGAPLAAGTLNVSAVVGVVGLNLGNLTGVSILIGSGDETLIGTAGDDIFNLTGFLAGTAGGFAFTGVGIINAAGGTDTVTLTGGNDTFAITGANAVSASGIAFTNIESVNAAGGTDTVMLTGGNDTFAITEANAGSTLGIAFTSIESVNAAGGTGDVFANQTGAAYAAGTSSVDSVAFSNFEVINTPALTLTAGDDAFAVSGANAGLLGAEVYSGLTSVDALAGRDTVTLTGGDDAIQIVGAEAATTAGIAFTNIEAVNAAGGTDTVTLTGASDTITVVGAKAATSAGIDFIAIEIVNGGAGGDSLNNISGVVYTAQTHSVAGISAVSFDTVNTSSLSLTTGDDLYTQMEANTAVFGGVNYGGTTNVNALDGDDTFHANAVLTGGFTFDGNSGGDVVNISVNQNGAGSLSFTAETINLNGFSLESAGDIILSATNPLTLTAPLTADGTVSVTGSVVLGADVAVTAGTAVTFANALSGSFGLTVNTAGTTTFNGPVGGTSALASLTTNAGGQTRINGGSVTTLGLQFFNDEVVLGNATTLDADVVMVAPAASISGSALLIARARLYVDGNSIGDSTALKLSNAAVVEVTGTETVESLFIDGIQMSAGTHGSNMSTAQFKDDTRFDGTGVVFATSDPAPVSYSDWAAIHAPSGGPADDFDGDGVPNAIEYILRGTKDTKDLDKLPVVTTPYGNFVVTFARDKASKSGDATVTIEVGANLAVWSAVFNVGDNTAGSSPGVTITDNGNGTDTVTLTLARASAPTKFARIAVMID